MTTTYLAWNGQSYPWPPPDGWYEASDGRWWAPGTGPNPPSPSTGADGVDKGRRAGPRSAVDDEQTVLTRSTSTIPRPLPALDDRLGAGHDRATDRATAGRSMVPLVLGGGVCVALLVIGAGFLALRSGGGQATIDEPGTVATEPVPTTTTVATTATSASVEATTTTLSDGEKVAQFRSLLAANELSSVLLTDGDILDFGAAFCVFAVAAADPAQFAELRQETVVESVGELTPDELAFAVDVAVTVFCSDQARRLGIEV